MAHHCPDALAFAAWADDPTQPAAARVRAAITECLSCRRLAHHLATTPAMPVETRAPPALQRRITRRFSGR